VNQYMIKENIPGSKSFQANKLKLIAEAGKSVDYVRKNYSKKNYAN